VKEEVKSALEPPLWDKKKVEIKNLAKSSERRLNRLNIMGSDRGGPTKEGGQDLQKF